MVVWVFASCGEAELGGLLPFLNKNYSKCLFQRRMPAKQKLAARPATLPPISMVAEQQRGLTGAALIRQIKLHLERALLSETCDLILIIDDLDCRNPDTQEQKFRDALKTLNPPTNIPILIGFAAPELESWIIADWGNTFAHNKDFRNDAVKIQKWLKETALVPFDNPEGFSFYAPVKDACDSKLSTKIIEACKVIGATEYSKAQHTALFLIELNPNRVAQRCKLFRQMHNILSESCKLKQVNKRTELP